MADYTGMRSRPIDNQNGKSWVRSSLTPQQKFNMEIPNRGGGIHKIEITRNTKPSIQISSNGPKIEKPNQSQNKGQFVPTIQRTPSAQPAPSIQKPLKITPNPSPAPAPSNTIQIQPKQASQPKPIIVQSAPAPPDFFSKMSLFSFVTSFKEGKSFNETDLFSLGLNMKKEEPMLPLLHSVLSEAPLLNHSCYPMPESYLELASNESPIEKMSMFSDQTLLFIFYTQPHTDLQLAAAEELQNKQYTYDDEKGTWSNADGTEWDANLWKVAQNAESTVADE